MPRVARHAPKGLVYHALNRAVARSPLFQKDADYEAFELVLCEAHEKFPLEVIAWRQTIARRLGLQSTQRPRGRPKKQAKE